MNRSALINIRMTRAQNAMNESIHRKWLEIHEPTAAEKFKLIRYNDVTQKVSTRRGKNPFMFNQLTPNK